MGRYIDHHEGDADDEADDDAVSLLAQVPLAGLCLYILGVPITLDAEILVARLFDGPAQVGRGGELRVVGDARPLGAEIHVDFDDARHALERVGHRPGAHDTGHAADLYRFLLVNDLIARFRDRLLEVVDADFLRVVLDGGRLAAQVDLRGRHPGQPRKRPLDRLHAHGAGHAVYLDVYFHHILRRDAPYLTWFKYSLRRGECKHAAVSSSHACDWLTVSWIRR